MGDEPGHDDWGARTPALLREFASDVATGGARLFRCDGTSAELSRYRAGDKSLGWHVPGTPTVGDLLVGTVGAGTGRMIVNVNRVTGIAGAASDRAFLWEFASDAPIQPVVRWRDVAARAWVKIEGKAAQAFLEDLLDRVEHSSRVAEAEGERAVATCRRRSSANRVQALDAARGLCGGCQSNFRDLLGALGDRVLDVHHLVPLSHRPEGVLTTGLDDLIVLCAVCHRLLHTDPRLDLEALEAGWAVTGRFGERGHDA
ncbi:HNH endonuclease [Nocardioides sp. C4-1]|uniref:HNH endonuclease n=1 Tax=Nocardioides sp. C4-1 TaxID=3151851 RepID=UPI003267295B